MVLANQPVFCIHRVHWFLLTGKFTVVPVIFRSEPKRNGVFFQRCALRLGCCPELVMAKSMHSEAIYSVKLDISIYSNRPGFL